MNITKIQQKIKQPKHWPIFKKLLKEDKQKDSEELKPDIHSPILEKKLHKIHV